MSNPASLSGAIAALVSSGVARSQPQFVDAAQIAARVDSEPFSGGQVAIDPTRPLIVTGLANRQTAVAVQHALTRVYPAEHPLNIYSSTGETSELPLGQLHQADLTDAVALLTPPLDWLEASRCPATLFRIIGRLRSPDGCPWDREQTHESLSDKVLEEAYEVADAIASGDPGDLRDELGDLLLLVALHAQIAEESGAFTIEDVFATVTQKLVRRHPHVFGDDAAATADDVLSTWKRVKAAERAESGAPRPALRYDQLPRSMSVIGRIRRAEGDIHTSSGKASRDIGSRLLTLVVEAMEAGVDPEQALEAAYREMRQQTIGSEETS